MLILTLTISFLKWLKVRAPLSNNPTLTGGAVQVPRFR